MSFGKELEFSNYIRIKNNLIDFVVSMNDRSCRLLLDEISGLIFDSFENGLSKEDLISSIMLDYNVSYEQIEKDYEQVYNLLSTQGFFLHPESGTMPLQSVYEETDLINQINELYYNNNRPYRVFLELTHACNLKCKHCYIDEQKNRFLSLTDCLRILDQLHDSGVVELFLTGGEIGLHPDLATIVEYASNLFLVTLLTNGTIFSEEEIKKLSLNRIFNVQISLYGDEQQHNTFVGSTIAWKRSFESLQYFRKYCGIGTAAIVATNCTYSTVPSLLKKLEKENINYLLTPIINKTIKGDERPSKYRITDSQLMHFFNFCTNRIGGNICTAGVSRFRISPEGVVTPCELLEMYPFGNILDSSFTEVLNSNERGEWINLKKAWTGDSMCQKCQISKYCPNCMGTNFLETGSFTSRSLYHCSVAKLQALSWKGV